MSAARTNWHAGPLPALDIADPFEVDVERAGKPIDLAGPTARLDVRLEELLRREAELDTLGVSCSLKERPDVVCTLCPISEAENDSPLGGLCRVAREQEAVCTQLAVQRHAEG